MKASKYSIMTTSSYDNIDVSSFLDLVGISQSDAYYFSAVKTNNAWTLSVQHKKTVDAGSIGKGSVQILEEIA